MQTINNVHEQFADFFKGERLRPFISLLSKRLSEGHICLDLKEILSGEYDFPFTYHSIEEIESDLLKEALVSTSFDVKQPFVLFNSQLYLQRYFAYETMILNRIQDFLKDEVLDRSQRVESIHQQREYILQLFSSDESMESLPVEERIDWQLVATILGVLNNFTIITGGPGTGKTTTVAKILDLLKRMNPDLKIGLAAPTGKAAMRLAESLNGAMNGDQPTTIHRMLKSIFGSHQFKHNRDNLLNFDIIIVDEASMIDAALFAKLLNAIGPHTRLILLGDKDQLASVEAGSLFRDLCQTQEKMNLISSENAELINSFIGDSSRKLTDNFISEKPFHVLSDHIIELKRSRRFDSNKGIGKLSKAIILNKSVDLQELFKLHADPQILIDTEYTPEVFRDFVLGYASYIREPDTQLALKKFNDLRVLCAIREGEHGLNKVNSTIEGLLEREGLISINTELYNNRPIIITRNYYDLGLFNGDIGIIRPDETNTLMAWFEGSDNNLRPILPSQLNDSETVFAMTVHKSQGSEYNRVLIVLPNNENSELLTRELVYTAVTRAREYVCIMGTENVLMKTINRTVKRASGIKERFTNDINIAT